MCGMLESLYSHNVSCWKISNLVTKQELVRVFVYASYTDLEFIFPVHIAAKTSHLLLKNVGDYIGQLKKKKC